MSGSAAKRLESLDVLRGFDMFFILLPDPVPCIVITFLAMFGLEHSAFAQQFDHCAWNGLRFQREWKIGLAWANTRGSLNSPS